jgi:hypothetical protein
MNILAILAIIALPLAAITFYVWVAGMYSSRNICPVCKSTTHECGYDGIRVACDDCDWSNK